MSSDDRVIRVGLIGYGLAGSRFHAPFIAATPGLRLRTVVTGSSERAAQAEREHPGVRVLPTTDALWAAAAEHDLVVVATPNRTHVALADEALAAGIGVVVDKPLAPSAAEASALIERAERAGRMLTVFQNRRWDGEFLTLQRLLREGRLGVVQRFESRFERWRPVPKPGWRQDPAPEAAGGVLFDLGSHLIDQALLLLGPAAQVYAELDRRGPVEVDDDAFVALLHRSGARSHLWMSSVAAAAGPRLRVLGSEAAYVKQHGDVQEAALRAGRTPDGEQHWGRDPREGWGVLTAGDESVPVPTERGDYGAFYAGVVRALRTGEPPPVAPGDAAEVLRVIDAARRSAAEHRTVAPRGDVARSPDR